MKRVLACAVALAVAGAVLAGAAIATVIVTREGGCDRAPPDDDDGMEPACMPGDEKCYGAEPPRDLPPG